MSNKIYLLGTGQRQSYKTLGTNEYFGEELVDGKSSFIIIETTRWTGKTGEVKSLRIGVSCGDLKKECQVDQQIDVVNDQTRAMSHGKIVHVSGAGEYNTPEDIAAVKTLLASYGKTKPSQKMMGIAVFK